MGNQGRYNFVFLNSASHSRKHNVTVPAAPVSIFRQPEVLVLSFIVSEEMFSHRLRKDIGILETNMRINVFRLHCRDRPKRTARPIGWIPSDSTPLQQHIPGEFIFKYQNVFCTSATIYIWALTNTWAFLFTDLCNPCITYRVVTNNQVQM
jgi:hypothetical protein